MTQLKIAGQYHVAWPGLTGELFDSNGLTTIEVPVNYPTLAVAFTVDPARVAQDVGLSGVKLVGSPISRSESDEILVTYKFQGINQTWDSTKADARATYALMGIDSEAPAGTHPNLVNIKTKYGWEPDDPKDANGPGHFPYWIKGVEANGKSPLYGYDAWEYAASEFTKTYVQTTGTGPASAWANVGKIVANPPELLKAFGLVTQNGRNWKVRSPQIESVGSAIRITEKWKLSDPGGWNADWHKYSGTL